MWVWMDAIRRMVWGESLLYLNAIPPVQIFQIVVRYPLRSLSALYEKKKFQVLFCSLSERFFKVIKIFDFQQLEVHLLCYGHTGFTLTNLNPKDTVHNG